MLPMLLAYFISFKLREILQKRKKHEKNELTMSNSYSIFQLHADVN